MHGFTIGMGQRRKRKISKVTSTVYGEKYMRESKVRVNFYEKKFELPLGVGL